VYANESNCTTFRGIQSTRTGVLFALGVIFILFLLERMMEMPTYKDQAAGTWYCKFYYVDWQGRRRQKLKRGFKLQREAKEWERVFLEQFAKNPDITFESLYLKYKEYCRPRIKENSFVCTFVAIDKHILPFFKNRIVSEISAADVAAWQNEILAKGLSNNYMHTINVHLSTLFNYAVDYVGLQKNPCRKLIGSQKAKEMDFWTLDEYKLFSAACRDSIEQFTIFEILYYTGMRIGELLALTLADVDFENDKISINKTYYLHGHKSTPPKTPGSNRVVSIPKFLAEEIREYVSKLYEPRPDDRLFDRSDRFVRYALNKTAELAGVKKIRVHDLRHSHASLLIDLGANIVVISKRLGHESPDITLKTYSHMFPSRQEDIARKMDALRI